MTQRRLSSWSAWAAVLLAVLLAACGGGTDMAGAGDARSGAASDRTKRILADPPGYLVNQTPNTRSIAAGETAVWRIRSVGVIRRVLLSVGRTAGDMVPTVTVTDAGGQVVASASGAPVVSLDFIPTQLGDLYVWISDSGSGNRAGSVDVFSTLLPPYWLQDESDCCLSLRSGAQSKDRDITVGDFDIYSLGLVEEGDHLMLTVRRTSGDLKPHLRLFDDNGQLVASAVAADDIVRLSVSVEAARQIFSVVVSDAPDGAGRTGGYHMEGLLASRAPAQEGVLRTNVEGADTLAGPAETRAFSLYATAGEGLSLAFRQTDGAMSPRVEVYSPSGRLLMAGSGPSLDLSARVLESGRHVVMVRDESPSMKLGGRFTLLPTRSNVAGDLNGDGRSDLLWQNRETGERAAWFVGGAGAPIGSGGLGSVPIEWRLVGSADMNSDGKSDLVWENTVTGQRLAWLMDGTTLVGSLDLGVIPTEWQIAALADFDGDLKPDLVWQNLVTGERVIWFVADGVLKGGVSFAQWDPGTRIVGAGDFDRDGNPDIMVEGRDGYGTWLRIHYMQGHFLRPWPWGVAGAIPRAWRIGMVADFNGDGQPDLVWQNDDTGERAIWWFENDTSYAGGGGQSLGVVGTGWDLTPVR